MGSSLRKLGRTRVVVVFGATSRIGMATIEELSRQQKQQHRGVSITVIAAVEDVKDSRARRLKRSSGCYLVRCKFGEPASIRRAVRNADAVLLVPALSMSGTTFSKRVIDAVKAESVARLVITSSVLATSDFWRRDRETPPSSAALAGSSPPDLGYEAVEAHARSVLTNCVSLRIPMLMETLMYCREEILFANRFYSCFDPDTVVPCIAVKDVAMAASRVLSDPTRKYNATYCLAGTAGTTTPREIEQQLSLVLGKNVKYRRVTDDQLVSLLRERGATLYVAQSIVRMKNHLEPPASAALEKRDDSHGAVDDDDNNDIALGPSTIDSHVPLDDTVSPTASTRRHEQIAQLGFTNDFAQLAGRELTTPVQWLEQTAKHFARTPQHEMQLFVVGSGDGFFAQFERFLAAQVTAATPVPARDVGEAAIPTTTGGATQAKVTFCAIKSVSAPAEPLLPASQQQSQQQQSQQQQQQRRWQRRGQQQLPRTDSYFYQMPGGIKSPLGQLLTQLSSQDVMVYIPPLHVSAEDRHEVTRVVVDAAAKANVWGIVVVSTIFTGLCASAQLNDLGAMEHYIERSGVPFVIVRLPLFMEYFLALSSVDYVHARTRRASTDSMSIATARSSRDASSVATGDPPSAAALYDDETEEKPRVAEPQDEPDTSQVREAEPYSKVISSQSHAAEPQDEPDTSQLREAEPYSKEASSQSHTAELHSKMTSSQSHAAEPCSEADISQLLQSHDDETAVAAAQVPTQEWNLLDRSLASSRQYLISMADAAKALAAIAFTFPLHQGRTRTLYTTCKTMQQIEATLQQFAYKGRAIAFAHVDALYEQPGREFWKVAHWPRSLTKELLECSVALSAQPAPVAMAMTFEEVTECKPISLERWARANARSYTRTLEVLDEM